MSNGIMGAIIIFGWMFGARLGWAWMGSVLKRRKARAIKADYRWLN